MNYHFKIAPAIKACAVVAACVTWLPAPAASAPRCADVVRAFLLSTRGELLSVKAKQDGCMVTNLKRRDGKRPLRVTRELHFEEADLIQKENDTGSA